MFDLFIPKAMRQWLLCIKNLFQCSVFTKDSAWLTRRDSFHASHLIDVIWENLEDPVSEVVGNHFSHFPFSTLVSVYEQ